MRLFIVIPKTATEEDIREEFSQWGDVESVTIVKEKNNGNPKGFGYVRFTKCVANVALLIVLAITNLISMHRFYYAAVAFENCSAKYKAVFAEPKGSTRTQRDHYGRPSEDNPLYSSSGRGNSNFNGGGSSSGGGGSNSYNNDWNVSQNNDMAAFLRMQNVPVAQPSCLEVNVSNCVNQDQLWRLFDIIPGLDYCQIMRERK